MTNVCLDLFAGLGGFSQAFSESDGWDVITVEIRETFDPDVQADIMDLTPAELIDAIGVPLADIETLVILASPPCTVFSTAGNHDLWDDKEPRGKAREHVALVYHTLGLIHALTPDYWLLENPRGRLRWILGQPTGTVTYCQYGKGYQKPTDLWGDHPPGMTYRSCVAGANCHASNTEDDGTSAIQPMPSDTGERAKVPTELSQSILDAVEQAPSEPIQAAVDTFT